MAAHGMNGRTRSAVGRDHRELLLRALRDRFLRRDCGTKGGAPLKDHSRQGFPYHCEPAQDLVAIRNSDRVRAGFNNFGGSGADIVRGDYQAGVSPLRMHVRPERFHDNLADLAPFPFALND
jgi:hypothetical protein